MRKDTIICLIGVFMFFSGYSQTDSTNTNSRDTLIKPAVTVIPKAEAAEKVYPLKKEPVYTLKPAVDIPIILVGSVFSLYATTKIYQKGPSTPEQINNLKTSDINALDRGSVYPYSKSLDENSYYPFYASMPLPFLMFLVTKDTRHDFWKLSYLYWEAMSVTGLFGTGAPYFIDRYRPYSYTSETPMDRRQSQNSKNSAFSGHVEIMATSTFFIAKVYGDYYPETKILMYGLASVATGGMAYMRLKGGMHFTSDIVIGAAIGTLSGILVPHFHKHRLIKNPSLGIVPFINEDFRGFVATYKFKK